MLTLLLEILATYRLAQLVSIDDGPFDLCKRWRLFLGRISYRHKILKTAADLMNCPYYLGVWFALFIVLALQQERWFLYWLAVAGGQAFLQELGGRYGA